MSDEKTNADERIGEAAKPVLTDEEREAIRWFSDYGDLQSEARRAEVLRGLLERAQ